MPCTSNQSASKKVFQLTAVFLLIIYSFSVTTITYAQTPSPNLPPVVRVQGNPLDDFFNAIGQLLGLIQKTFDPYINASIPQAQNIKYSGYAPTIAPDKNIGGADTGSGYHVVGDYVLGNAAKGPAQASTNLFDWFSDIKDRILGENKSNKEAGDFVSIFVPKDAAEKSSTVDKAYLTARCAALPAGSCDGNNLPNGTGTPGVSAAPTNATTSITPGPTAAVSPTPYPVAAGECAAGTDYCSVDYLRPFFGPDENIVKQASQICNVESNGSNQYATNFNCLTGTSMDYSVSLFQINLLAHCGGAFKYSGSQPVMPCQVSDQSKVDACMVLWMPDKNDTDQEQVTAINNNINKAVELSGHGTNWHPWGAARYCKIVQ